MKCKNCVNLVDDWCDMKADSPYPDMERECHWFAQKTNADKHRAMTDEELAKYMVDIRTWGGCPNRGAIDCQTDCFQCWLDWLQKEAPHDP